MTNLSDPNAQRPGRNWNEFVNYEDISSYAKGSSVRRYFSCSSMLQAVQHELGATLEELGWSCSHLLKASQSAGISPLTSHEAAPLIVDDSTSPITEWGKLCMCSSSQHASELVESWIGIPASVASLKFVALPVESTRRIVASTWQHLNLEYDEDLVDFAVGVLQHELQGTPQEFLGEIAEFLTVVRAKQLTLVLWRQLALELTASARRQALGRLPEAAKPTEAIANVTVRGNIITTAHRSAAAKEVAKRRRRLPRDAQTKRPKKIPRTAIEIHRDIIGEQMLAMAIADGQDVQQAAQELLQSIPQAHREIYSCPNRYYDILSARDAMLRKKV